MTASVTSTIKAFKGLNNVGDPQRLGLSWLTQADNVDVTDRSALVRAGGFAQRSTNFAVTGAYATNDLQRLYVVDQGEMRQMNLDLTGYTVLRSGLTAAKMYFEEVNGVVFYSNGVDFGLLEPDGPRPWGIAPPTAPAVAVIAGSLPAGTYQVVCTLVDSRGQESSNSAVVVATTVADGGLLITPPQVAGHTTNVYVTEPNGTVFFLFGDAAVCAYTDPRGARGRELPFQDLDTPRGSILAHFQGQMYAGEYFPDLDQSVIWRSLPLHYHLFNLGGEAIAVPGAVRMVVGLAEALIIGTDRQIWAYDGETIKELAPYGVVPGWHASKKNNALYFWSLRGLCRALPFANLTESTVSVPPGLSAGAAVIESNGMRRYVVALRKGGEAFNRRIT
jgi:hypothetical protein